MQKEENMKRRMKRIVSMALCAVMLFSAVSAGIGGFEPLTALAACSGGCVSDGTLDFSHSGCKEPTCTDAGYAITYCAVCADEMLIEVAPKGHPEPDLSTVTVTVAPTCLDAGTGTYYCPDCLAPCACEIPALGHSIENAEWEIVKAASCKELGKNVKYCTICGEVADEEYFSEEHELGPWITTIVPTCTNEGEKVRKCISCGEIIESEAIPATEHIKGEKITVEAACGSEGYTLVRCAECGICLEQTAINAEKHSSGDWKVITAPSCTVEGYREKT